MKLGLFALILTAAIFAAGCTGPRFSTRGGWSGPVVVDNVAYMGTQEGRVLAVDLQGGINKWSFPDLRTEEEPLGRVLYGTPVVDVDKGLDEGAEGEAVSAKEKRVYFGTYDSLVYALNAEDGREAWEKGPTLIDGHIIGGVTLAGRDQCVGDQRGLEGDVLLVGSTGGFVYALCTNDGSVSWRFPPVDSVGEVWSSPTVEGDTVYFGDLDHRLYAVSLDKGIPLWAQPFEAGGAIVASPLVVDGKVYFGALDQKFYAVDARSGTTAWSRPFKAGSWFWAGAVTDGKRIYAADAGGKLYGLDKSTGLKQWEADVGGMVISTPVLAELGGETRLIIATKEGRMSVRRTDRDQEEWGPVLTNAEGHALKVKAPLGLWESTVLVNTMDPWTVQALNLSDGKVSQLFPHGG